MCSPKSPGRQWLVGLLFSIVYQTIDNVINHLFIQQGVLRLRVLTPDLDPMGIMATVTRVT
jgi:hypothetical protein